MSTRRMIHGIAVTPERDLDLLRDMAAHGHRLVRMSPSMQWVFEDAAPEDVDFAFATLEPNDRDAVAMFEAADWELACSADRLHVFRAPAGTPPIHTETASLRDELHDNALRYSKVAGIALALFVAATVLLTVLGASRLLTAVVLVVLCIPVIFAGLPALATWRRLHTLN